MIKKNCCRIGSHRCTVIITNPPKHLGYTKPVCVDKCLVPAIKALWKAGFVTFASCCGHGQVKGRIDFELYKENTG